MIISPGLAGIGNGCGCGRGLDISGLDLNPLLGLGQIVSGIPLALASGIRRAVRHISIGGHAVGGLLLGVAVGEGFGATRLDFGQASVRNSGIGLSALLCLGGLGLSSGGLGEQRVGVGNRERLDTIDYDWLAS